MSEFLTKLQVTPIDEDNWELTAPLIYRSTMLGKDIYIKAGTVTDFASVPEVVPIIHLLFAEAGKMAAVVHDYLLVEGAYRRATCDEVFYEALKCCPEVKWKAWPMFAGVSLWTRIKNWFSI